MYYYYHNNYIHTVDNHDAKGSGVLGKGINRSGLHSNGLGSIAGLLFNWSDFYHRIRGLVLVLVLNRSLSFGRAHARFQLVHRVHFIIHKNSSASEAIRQNLFNSIIYIFNIYRSKEYFF